MKPQAEIMLVSRLYNQLSYKQAIFLYNKKLGGGAQIFLNQAQYFQLVSAC